MKPPSPDRLIGWVLVAYYLGAIAVGLSGMEWPSQKLSIGLGIGAQVYSVGMVITGCIGVAANVVGSRRAEGVAIAREMLAAVRGRVAGAYIMPPLERYELALEVVDGYLDR